MMAGAGACEAAVLIDTYETAQGPVIAGGTTVRVRQVDDTGWWSLVLLPPDLKTQVWVPSSWLEAGGAAPGEGAGAEPGTGAAPQSRLLRSDSPLFFDETDAPPLPPKGVPLDESLDIYGESSTDDFSTVRISGFSALNESCTDGDATPEYGESSTDGDVGVGASAPSPQRGMGRQAIHSMLFEGVGQPAPAVAPAARAEAPQSGASSATDSDPETDFDDDSEDESYHRWDGPSPPPSAAYAEGVALLGQLTGHGAHVGFGGESSTDDLELPSSAPPPLPAAAGSGGAGFGGESSTDDLELPSSAPPPVPAAASGGAGFGGESSTDDLELPSSAPPPLPAAAGSGGAGFGGESSTDDLELPSSAPPPVPAAASGGAGFGGESSTDDLELPSSAPPPVPAAAGGGGAGFGGESSTDDLELPTAAPPLLPTPACGNDLELPTSAPPPLPTANTADDDVPLPVSTAPPPLPATAGLDLPFSAPPPLPSGDDGLPPPASAPPRLPPPEDLPLPAPAVLAPAPVAVAHPPQHQDSAALPLTLPPPPPSAVATAPPSTSVPSPTVPCAAPPALPEAASCLPPPAAPPDVAAPHSDLGFLSDLPPPPPELALTPPRARATTVAARPVLQHSLSVPEGIAPAAPPRMTQRRNSVPAIPMGAPPPLPRTAKPPAPTLQRQARSVSFAHPPPAAVPALGQAPSQAQTTGLGPGRRSSAPPKAFEPRRRSAPGAPNGAPPALPAPFGSRASTISVPRRDKPSRPPPPSAAARAQSVSVRGASVFGRRLQAELSAQSMAPHTPSVAAVERGRGAKPALTPRDRGMTTGRLPARGRVRDTQMVDVDVAFLQNHLKHWVSPEGFRMQGEAVHQGLLIKISRDKAKREKAQPRHFFLFDQVLVYCKREKSGRLDVRGKIPVCDLVVKDLPDGQLKHDGRPVLNAFEINNFSKKKWYVLYASTAQMKGRWLHALQSLTTSGTGGGGGGGAGRHVTATRRPSAVKFGFEVQAIPTGGVRVSAVTDAAACPGLAVGDSIEQINGISVHKLQRQEVVSLLDLSPAGSAIDLLVAPSS